MKRTIRLYTAFQFFFSLLLWLPIFYEYQRRMGLSDTEIFAIQSMYQIFFCLLEIPTGMVADFWGRRRCMILGAAMLLVANLMAIFAANYAGFLVHFMLVAVSRSFVSGASSAYLYDYLSSEKAQAEYRGVEGRARSIGLVGGVIGWAFMGMAMQWHVTIPYWLTAGSAALAFVAASLLPSLAGDGVARLGAEADAAPAITKVRSNFTEVWRMMRSSPLLVFVMFQGVVVFVFARLQINFFQPLLGSKFFSVQSFGWLMSLITVFEALGAARPSWIQRRLGDFASIFILTAILSLTLVSFPLVDRLGTVVLLCLFSFIQGLAFPIQKQLINDQIRDSRYRATVMSIESIVDRCFSAAAAYFMGWYLSRGHLDWFFVRTGLMSLAFTLIMILIFVSFRRVAKSTPA